MVRSLQDEARRLRRWMTESALPLWTERSIDPAGGVYEALTHDGAPIENAPKRLRVQARQVYSFARAERLGWIDDAREACDHAWQFMVDKGQRQTPEGLPAFIHVFEADGAVKDDRIDLYDHAFVLLASTEREIQYGCEEARRVSAEVIALIESLARDNGGFDEGIPAVLPRRTNPHMHLLETCILRRDALACPFAERVIGEVLKLWDRHFWDESECALREFFADDWSVHQERGSLVEPGHMAEWLYLLNAAAPLSDARAERLFARTRELGLYERQPILADSYDLSSDERAEGARLWSQTEHIRAALVMARRTGQERYQALAAELIAAFFDLYLSGVVPGGWYDRLDPKGAPISDRMPTSLLYHMVTLVEEIDAHLRGE